MKLFVNMDIQSLNLSLSKIAEKKNELSTLSYSDETYDKVEEELHALEDEMMENFGTFLEEAINDVHDEYCPDTEVLSPIAYMAKKYETDDGSFKVGLNEGVPVEMDDYPGVETRLVIVPGPPRIILQVGKDSQEVVWTAS